MSHSSWYHSHHRYCRNTSSANASNTNANATTVIYNDDNDDDTWLNHLLEKQGIPVHQQRLIFGVDGPISLDPITGERTSLMPTQASSSSGDEFANMLAQQSHFDLLSNNLQHQQQQQQHSQSSSSEASVQSRDRKRRRVEEEHSDDYSATQDISFEQACAGTSSSTAATFHHPSLSDVNKLGPVALDMTTEQFLADMIHSQREQMHSSDHRSSNSSATTATANATSSTDTSNSSAVRTLQRQFESVAVHEQNNILRRLLEEQDKQNNEIEELKSMVSSLTEQLSKMLR